MACSILARRFLPKFSNELTKQSASNVFSQLQQRKQFMRSFYKSSPLQGKIENVTITFVMANGERFKRTGAVGLKMEELITEDEHPGLQTYGACGGVCECSTCHVIFSEEDYKKLEKPRPEEGDVICYAGDEVCETSRLACEIMLTKDMDGITVRLPEFQYDRRQLI